VLQRLGGPAAAETENIPRHVAFADETESLLHHSDKILVLQWVADALAKADQSLPKAPLFEAYARLALGERERAASLLMRYVAENEHNPGQYSLLCECLYDLSDFSSLLLICREWEERDPGCREDRSRYLWAALYTLGRHADAEASMQKEESCLGWQAGVYAAKAALATGKRSAAEKHLEHSLERFPDRSRSIRRLWEQIKGREGL
jgi:tetratricopeptide (TPR) repeat protein